MTTDTTRGAEKATPERPVAGCPHTPACLNAALCLSAREPVTHWTPEEEFYAECGGGQEGDFGIINPDKVTCPGCRAAIDEAEGPTP